MLHSKEQERQPIVQRLAMEAFTVEIVQEYEAQYNIDLRGNYFVEFSSSKHHGHPAPIRKYLHNKDTLFPNFQL